jgi:tetratricopeptide (TPR) repeat protein
MKQLLTMALTLGIASTAVAQVGITQAPDDDSPAGWYTTAQIRQREGAFEQAMELYRRLADLPEGDAWRFIGESAQQLVQDQNAAALESAQRAVAANGALAEAHYQLGLAQARHERWREAAASFDRAAELNPGLAYAHYYGGLMHYRANRTDRMAIHFEQFLKLAPEAPERPEVLQIMRTIRGR